MLVGETTLRPWEPLAIETLCHAKLSKRLYGELMNEIHRLIDSVRKEVAYAATEYWKKKILEERADMMAGVMASRIPMRDRLPAERQSITKRFEVVKLDGTPMRVYATVGLYTDGHPGELFIHADKVGTTAHGALDAAAVAISVGLQYGVPLRVYTEKLKGTRFGPEYTKFGDADCPRGASILALVALWLEEKFPMKEEVK